MTAHDLSSISAVTGAASLAGSLGPTNGIAISLGVAVGLNEIGNVVDAYIAGATVTTESGNLAVTARTGRDPLFNTALTPEQLDDAATRDEDDPNDPADDAILLGLLSGEFTDAGLELPDINTTATVSKYTTASQDPQDLAAGDTVKLADDYAGGGTPGAVYRFRTGTDQDVDLGSENYGLAARWELVPADFDFTLLEEGNSWLLTDGNGKNFVLELDTGGAVVVSESSINAVSAAASAAIAVGGSIGGGLSGAGAAARNVIQSKTNAFIDDAEINSGAAVTVDASSTSAISSVVLAASVAIGGGGETGVGVSIGAAVANNFIGYDTDGDIVRDLNGLLGSQVRSYIVDSTVVATDAVSHTAFSEQAINSLVLAGSVGVAAGGNTGVAASGSGVSTENKIGVAVESFIDGDTSNNTITAGSVSLEAADSSMITSLAGAASLAASLGGNTGVAVSIGVSLATNTISNEVAAYIADETIVTTGDIRLIALESAAINSISVAASLAATAGGTLAVAVSGAGAESVNFIDGDVNAFVDGSNLDLSDLGNVDIDASNAARINAFVVGASAALSGGGTVGGAASIGVSIARNYIGWEIDPTLFDAVADLLLLDDTPTELTLGNLVKIDRGARNGDVFQYIGETITEGVDLDDIILAAQDYANRDLWTQVNEVATASETQAFLRDTSIANALDVTVDAVSTQAISAEVFALSAAVSGGGIVGVGLSGAGSSSTNKIASDVRAFVDGDGTSGIDAASLALDAADNSSINATTAAASLAAALGGVVGGAASIGVALSFNEISSEVDAYLANADSGVSTTGDITILATAQGEGRRLFDIPLFDLDNASTSTPDDTETATNEAEADFNIDVGILTDLVAAFADEGLALIGDPTADADEREINLAQLVEGEQWALIAKDGATYFLREALGVLQVSEASILATSAAASLAASAGGLVGISLSGAGAEATNSILTRLNAFVEDSQITTADNVDIDALDTATIASNVLTASLSAAAAGSNSFAASIGAAVANNLIGFDRNGDAVVDDSTGLSAAQVRAYVQDSTIDASGALTIDASAQQSISTLVVSGSVAVALGVFGSAGVSGSGVSTLNKIGATVQAFIDGDGTGIEADSIAVAAQDTSVIRAFAGAVSLAAALDFTGSAALSIGISLAENTITSEVDAFIANADTQVSTDTGDIDVAASGTATINATSAAASLGAAGGIIAGLALSGAGAEATNIIQTKTNATVSDSVLNSGLGVAIDADNASTIDATVLGFSASIGVGLVSVAGSIGVAVAENRIGGTSGGNSLAQIYAQAIDSSIDTTGTLLILADSDQEIDATVLAGSAAVAAGGLALAGSGAAALADNQVTVDTKARIVGDGDIDVAAATIRATDMSEIDAFTGAVSIGAAAGVFVGASLSIGIAQATNDIGNITEAAILDSGNSVTATDAASTGILVQAIEGATVTAQAAAAALAVGVSPLAGVAYSGAGAETINNIVTFTQALVDGSSLDSAAGVQVDAQNDSTIVATLISASASVAAGAIAVADSLGSSFAENSIGSTTQAAITDSTVVADTNVDVTATGSETSMATVNSFAISIIAAAVGVSDAEVGSSVLNTVETEVNAFIGDASVTDAIDTQVTAGGTVKVEAIDAATIRANVGATALSGAVALFGGSVSLSVSNSENDVANDVAASVSSATVSAAGGISILANQDASIRGTADTASASDSLLFSGAAGGSLVTNIDDSNALAFADRSTLNSSGGGLTVNAFGKSVSFADSTTDAAADGLISVASGGANSVADIERGVTAFVGSDGGGATTVNVAGTVAVTAESVGEADTKSIGNTSGSITSGKSLTTATLVENVDSFLGENASVVAGGDVIVDAIARDVVFSIPTDEFDVPDDVDDVADTINFPIELDDGDTVVYIATNFPFPGLFPVDPDDVIGGLEDGRSYRVLTDGNLVQFGSQFEGTDVDPEFDTITFETAHLLEDGDRVVYQTAADNLGDLMGGTTYEVAVVDEFTIKLVDSATLESQAFDDADLVSDVFNVAGHPFEEEQAVTYRTAGTFEFRIASVDQTVSVDAEGNVSFTPNPNAENIVIGENVFQDGDLVIYRSDVPLIGLEDGKVYEVVPDPNSNLAIQLRDPDTMEVVPMITIGAPASVFHTVEAVEIEGLNDGQTYYIVTRTDTTFQVANSPTGTPLTGLDASAATGTHFFATEAVDLDMADGPHTVHIDLDLSAGGAGTQRLAGPGGLPLFLFSLPEGNGQSLARVEGAAGADFGGAGENRGTMNATANATAYVDAASVTAAGNVSITSSASKDVYATANNGQSGLVGFGRADAQTTFTANSSALVGNNVSGVVIDAGGDFTLSASSDHEAKANALGRTGSGLGDNVRAFGNVDLINDTLAQVGSSSMILAGGHLSVDADSQTGLDAASRADAGGFSVGTDAESNIVSTTFDVDTRVRIQPGAVLKANSVSLEGTVTALNARVDADAKAAAIGADSDATARLSSGDVNSDVSVIIRPNVIIRGEEGVDLRARHDGVSTFADADARCGCGAGDTDTTARNGTQLSTVVDADATATIIAGPRDNTSTRLHSGSDLDFLALFIEAESPDDNISIRSDADSSSDFIDVGRESANTDGKADDVEIRWDADAEILLGNGIAELLIDENGIAQIQENIVYEELFGIIFVREVAEPGGDLGQVLFESDDDSATASGSLGTFRFQQAWERVVITNLSDMELQINGDIQVYNDLDDTDGSATRAGEDIRIDVPTVTVEFDVAPEYEPSTAEMPATFEAPLVEITSQQDIRLFSLIDNPVGTTRVTSVEGEITGSFDRYVRTNIFEASAAGDIGGDPFFETGRVYVQLVVSDENNPTQLTAEAGGNVRMNIQGLLRDNSVSSFVVHSDRVDAEGFVDLRLEEGLRQAFPLITDGFPVDIDVIPDGNGSLPFLNHFRPDTGGSNLPLGVFADTAQSTAIETTYDFGLIEAGGGSEQGNIDIEGLFETASINVSGNTNIVLEIDFDLGNIDVFTNGDVFLIESEGDQPIGRVESTEGDVTVGTANGSVIDNPEDGDSINGDAGNDVVGRDVTFLASGGGVGTKINVIQVNSSVPEAGVLAATAQDDIFITETAATLNLGLVESTSGDVRLVANTGSILDGNNGGTNVRGNAIDLIASNGSIGVGDNGIEIDSSNADAGRLIAEADGEIYIIEVSGELNVLFVQNGTGDVRLDVVDSAAEGDDLILLESGMDLSAAMEDVNGAINAAGLLRLIAGDDVLVPLNASIFAESAALLFVDPFEGNADAEGGIATLWGVIDASAIRLNGGINDDLFIVDGNAGDVGDGGTVENLIVDLTVDGGLGIDTLQLDDTGDTTADTIIAAGGDLANLVDGGSLISYLELETLEIHAGTAADTLQIDGTNPHEVRDDLIFHAGDPTTEPGDSVEILGGTFGSIVYTYFNPNDGTIDIDFGDLGLITYTSVEDGILTTAATTGSTFILPDTDDTTTLAESLTMSGLLELDGGEFFQTTTFEIPTEGILVSGSDGNDTLILADLTGLDVTAEIAFEGNDGDDLIDITFAPALTIRVDGGSPTLPTLPGDTLLIDTRGRSFVHTEGEPGAGMVSIVDSTFIDYVSIETFFINPVNTAPENVLPTGDFTVPTNRSLTFSATNGTEFSVIDIDAGDETDFMVTLTVEHGTLTLVDASGITVTGDGSLATPLMLTGSLFAINAALAAGLVYTPDFEFVGFETLTILSDDKGNGGGDALTDEDTLRVNVDEPSFDFDADFDKDGDVDGVDFLIWQENFITLSGATPNDGDADGDGDVDGEDFLIWQQQFVAGTSGNSTRPAEPDSPRRVAVDPNQADRWFARFSPQRQPLESEVTAALARDVARSWAE